MVGDSDAIIEARRRKHEGVCGIERAIVEYQVADRHLARLEAGLGLDPARHLAGAPDGVLRSGATTGDVAADNVSAVTPLRCASDHEARLALSRADRFM